MKIRGIEVDVDILEELNRFSWKKARVRGDEFLACSPFREERHPSFSVNLQTGLFIDFGNPDEFWRKGNFIKLLAFLENITFEEAEEMLLESYGINLDTADSLELSLNLELEKPKPKIFTVDELRPYLYRHKSYLLRRGISEEIMKKFVVGYDKEQQAVAFFWQDAKTGKVVNVKFRSIKGKQFYYIEGGQPIRHHIFALYHVIKEGHKEVFIVESEIDALYLWTHGYPAIAIGGSNLTEEQKELLLMSGIETLILATDNDTVGRSIRKSIIKNLGGYMNLKNFPFPEHAKDVNDLTPEELHRCVKEIEDVNIVLM
jgi:DNA primase